jgi:hypothetical protein
VGPGETVPNVILQPAASFTGYIVLSCFVFWFCGWLFGLIAFILAVAAQNSAPRNPAGARKLGIASVALSITGIIVGITVIVLVVVFVVVVANKEAECVAHGNWFVNGRCYMYRNDDRDSCDGLHHKECYWDGFYCYFNN